MTESDTLGAQSWEQYRTILVYDDQVSKAMWLHPSSDGTRPGVLVAPGPNEARELLKREAPPKAPTFPA